MVASAVYEDSLGLAHPELKDKRVLLTGIDGNHGWRVAQAFGEFGARLVLHSGESVLSAPPLVELAEIARGLNVCSEPVVSDRDAVRFAQGPAQKAFGGLEIVVNLVSFAEPEVAETARSGDLDEVEGAIADKFLVPTMIGRVAANRMRLTWTKGMILNVVTMPDPSGPAEAAYADVVRASVATWTRKEAIRWADQEIRINAVAPQTGIARHLGENCLTSEDDVSALAVFLASQRGEQLTGHVFDAAGLATSTCSF